MKFYDNTNFEFMYPTDEDLPELTFKEKFLFGGFLLILGYCLHRTGFHF